MFALQGFLLEKYTFQFGTVIIDACRNKANYFFHSNIISCSFSFLHGSISVVAQIQYFTVYNMIVIWNI